MNKHFNRKRRKTHEKTSPGVTIKSGTAKEHFPIEEFDPAAMLSIAEAAADSGKLEVTFVEPASWPAEKRYNVLSSLAEMGGCDIRIGGTQFSDAFEALLDQMPPADDPRHVACLQAVVEAAALFRGQIPELAASEVSQRLRKLGTRLTTSQITKMIKAVAGQGPEAKKGEAGPMKLAAGFIAALSAESNDNDIPPLLFFHDDFYTYREDAWQRTPVATLEAMVTRHLQATTKDVVSVTVRDVITNLRGLALLNVSRDTPFFIDDFADALVSNRNLLGMQNGLLDVGAMCGEDLLPGQELMPHDQRWFAQAKLSFDFDPAAECPAWQSFIAQMLPPVHDSDRRVQILQEFFGYCFLLDCRFEKMLILLGNGANGKSVILNVLSALLGCTNVSAVPFDQLCGEFRMIELRGKLANVTREISHLGRVNEGLLKAVISGEEISANRKHLSPVKIRPHAKLVAATNELPTFSETADGLWRRLIIMPLYKTVPEAKQNRALAAELVAELPGILNWAVEGLKRLLTQNHFTHCTACDSALVAHRVESDTVREFLLACCKKQAGTVLDSQRVYELYGFFTERRKRKPVAENVFGKRVKQAGWIKCRGRAVTDGHRPWVYKDQALTEEGKAWLSKRNQDLQQKREWVEFAEPSPEAPAATAACGNQQK